MRVLVESMGDHNLAFAHVNRPNLSFEEVHMSQHLTDRVDDVGQIKVARRDLVKHRREQEEIVLTDQRDFKIKIPTLFKLQRGVQAAKATAEDDDTILFHVFLVFRSGLFPGRAPDQHCQVQIGRIGWLNLTEKFIALIRCLTSPRKQVPLSQRDDIRRRYSPIDQAWNGQPLGVCGGSASTISEM
jgi:hypothetical protein